MPQPDASAEPQPVREDSDCACEGKAKRLVGPVVHTFAERVTGQQSPVKIDCQ